MRILIVLSLLSMPFFARSQSLSALIAYDPIYAQARFKSCETARSASYLTTKERQLITILNALRMDPPLFARLIVAHYPDSNGTPWMVNSAHYKSLLDTLSKMQPLQLLEPNKRCFQSAQCHAVSSGASGYSGHERQSQACSALLFYEGECIDYGGEEPLEILLDLLIDEDVPSLGHRIICLSEYRSVGVAIRTHKKFGTNTVLDFHF